MKYELTQHAKTVLQERGIRIEWVEKVLNNPAFSEPDSMDSALEHRLGEIEERDNRVLRVVANAQVEPTRVVTVYFDRKMKGKL